MAREPRHRIPSKQQHWAGTLDALLANLLEREIGLCTDDGKCYIKHNGALHPMGAGSSLPAQPAGTSILLSPNAHGSPVWVALTASRVGAGAAATELWSAINGRGIVAARAISDSEGRPIVHLESGIGIEIDADRRINLTERDQYVPANGTPITGALRIIDSPNITPRKVRLGNSGDLGALLPIPGTGDINKALVVGANGTIEWVVSGADIDSPDESIAISTDVDQNKNKVHISIPAGAITHDKLADGVVAMNNVDMSDTLPIIGANGVVMRDMGYAWEVSLPNTVGDVGRYDSGTPEHTVIVGAGSTKLRLDIQRANALNLSEVTVTLYGNYEESTWLLSGYVCLVCRGVASGGGNYAIKQSSAVSSAFDDETAVSTTLQFFAQGSVPATFDVTLDVYLIAIVNGVKYCARCDIVYRNMGSQNSSPEIVGAIGSVTSAEAYNG